MTVYIEKPAVNLREELASLRNQGGYQEQQFWYENAVTNGTFDTDVSGWTKLGDAATTFTYDSGSCLINAATAYDGISQTITGLTIGWTYILSADFTLGTSSSCHIRAGSFDTIQGSSSTTLESVFVANSTSLTIQAGSGNSSGTLNVDNIFVLGVDANDDVVHRLPKGWKPKDVFEDGLLQREGAAHDYEVVYDGFDYYVKPAVAPSATTQTCVIGVKA